MRAAKDSGAIYYYPGTVYGDATNYKTNFPNLEFWNGETWVKDAKNKALRERTKTDSKRQIKLLDEWKQNHPLF